MGVDEITRMLFLKASHKNLFCQKFDVLIIDVKSMPHVKGSKDFTNLLLYLCCVTPFLCSSSSSDASKNFYQLSIFLTWQKTFLPYVTCLNKKCIKLKTTHLLPISYEDIIIAHAGAILQILGVNPVVWKVYNI